MAAEGQGSVTSHLLLACLQWPDNQNRSGLCSSTSQHSGSKCASRNFQTTLRVIRGPLTLSRRAE